MDIELEEEEAEEASHPQDLLHRLSSTRCSYELLPMNCKAEDEGDTELSLGLSLGGCFAVETREPRLVRSSSTAMMPVLQNEFNFTCSSATLARTCSLPVEAEGEQLKRKEMQEFKRMELKRKQLEKKSSARQMAEVGSGYRKDGVWIGGIGSKTSNSSSSSAAPSISGTYEKSLTAPPLPPLLRTLKSFQEDNEVLKKMAGNLNRSKVIGRNIMAEMPCVSTTGGGPRGRRIEGFLHNYTGGELRIVCLCHGSCHSPAEFVRHAGGGEVENPLRHIVVTRVPSTYNY
ncbi:ninja-family protein AFP3-like [Phalaenopsis equestris]|uniref:ninja-family protein AFP3-like n=1 Tax=Phalaenopsis equestris TaxID=78828 RepID=UPI0009E3F583|nr:ninja-family protein AFP3-like [Phalaenopsis equestris]